MTNSELRRVVIFGEGERMMGSRWGFKYCNILIKNNKDCVQQLYFNKNTFNNNKDLKQKEGKCVRTKALPPQGYSQGYKVGREGCWMGGLNSCLVSALAGF